jgi:hypothetical protein
MRIDSDGNVGIGRSDPQNIVGAHGGGLVVKSASGRAATTTAVAFQDSSGNNQFQQLHNGQTTFSTGSTERMRITSSGNVGINSTDPSTGRLVIPQSNSSQPAISLPTDESTIQGPHANTQIKMGGNLSLNGASIISLGTGGSEAMRISSAGSVGIGNSSPVEFLTIGDTSDSATKIQLLSSTSGVNTIHFGDGTSGSSLYRGYINYAHSTDSMAFGTSTGDRVTIDNNGDVGIGITSYASYGSRLTVSENGGSSSAMVGCVNTATSGTRRQIDFFDGSSNTRKGSIETNGSNTSFNTSSDYRLKENVTYTWDATERLKQLKPARFNFIADVNKTIDGFLAHEVSSVVPSAVGQNNSRIRSTNNSPRRSIKWQSHTLGQLVKLNTKRQAAVKV